MRIVLPLYYSGKPEYCINRDELVGGWRAFYLHLRFERIRCMPRGFSYRFVVGGGIGLWRK